MPGLSAQPEILAETVRAAVDHGASFVWANVLHLGPRVREGFMEFLAREFPQLLNDYASSYVGKYARPTTSKPILNAVNETVSKYVLDDRTLPYVEAMAEMPRQLVLPL